MLTGGPALARCCRLEITSAETQRRPEEIRAQLLNRNPLVSKLSAPPPIRCSSVICPGRMRPIGQPIEHEEHHHEHHHPDNEQACRKHEIETGVHMHRQVRISLATSSHQPNQANRTATNATVSKVTTEWIPRSRTLVKTINSKRIDK